MRARATLRLARPGPLRGTVAPDMSIREAPALTWTVEDAAWQMGVSVATVRRLIQRGQLPGCYQTRRYTNTGPGGMILRRIAWRVPDAAIRGWQAKQAAATAARHRPAEGREGRIAQASRAAAPNPLLPISR